MVLVGFTADTVAAIHQSFPPQHRSSAVLRIATPKPHLKCYVALHKQTAVVQMSVWSSTVAHKFYSQANEGGHTVLKQENSGQLQNRHQEQFNSPSPPRMGGATRRQRQCSCPKRPEGELAGFSLQGHTGRAAQLTAACTCADSSSSTFISPGPFPSKRCIYHITTREHTRHRRQCQFPGTCRVRCNGVGKSPVGATVS